MKKILVTGASGFIGSHLTELLVEKNYDVVAFDRYNPNNDWGWLEHSKYKNDFEVILGDIRDYDSVYATMKNCDVVFHLAALIGIPYSYISPLAYIRTNIEGTYNVLEASKQLNIEQILITSTSETYGTAQYVPIDELHPVNAQSPYSASKISADQLALSYYRSFDSPVKIIRPFNTYGPRQSARAIIPTVITQILDGKNVLKLGNVTPTRDLTYIADTVRGFFEILRTDSFLGETTNIGMNEEISIRELVNMIGEVMGEEIQIVTDEDRVRPQKSEVERLWCDNSKLVQNTDWTIEYDLRSGISETLSWIKENIKYFKPEVFNV